MRDAHRSRAGIPERSIEGTCLPDTRDRPERNDKPAGKYFSASSWDSSRYRPGRRSPRVPTISLGRCSTVPVTTERKRSNLTCRECPVQKTAQRKGTLHTLDATPQPATRPTIMLTFRNNISCNALLLFIFSRCLISSCMLQVYLSETISRFPSFLSQLFLLFFYRSIAERRDRTSINELTRYTWTRSQL